MLLCVLQLYDEIMSFLDIQDKSALLAEWSHPDFKMRLAYLVDIFLMLKLNVELRGKGGSLINSVEKIKLFVLKLSN